MHIILLHVLLSLLAFHLSKKNHLRTCPSLNFNCFAIMHIVDLLGYAFSAKVFLKTDICSLFFIKYFFSTWGQEVLWYYFILFITNIQTCKVLLVEDLSTDWLDNPSFNFHGYQAQISVKALPISLHGIHTVQRYCPTSTGR